MKKISATAVMAVMTVAGALADNDWLHIYNNAETPAIIYTTPVDEVVSMGYEGEDDGTFSTLRIDHAVDGAVPLDLTDVGQIAVGTNVPTVYITTDSGQIPWSKTEWWRGTVSVRGYGAFPDIDCDSINLRCRGNSTMTYPKKPFRMKLDKKRDFLGLKKAKNFALLANYIDNTLMRNAMAMKLGEMLGTPYVNHMIPVNLVMNGEYYGSFTVTEKLGINSGSIDDIDEAKGMLWEIGADDEDYVYNPVAYPSLPVAVKDPDPADFAGADPFFSIENWYNMWKNDLDETMASIKEGAEWGHESNWDDYIDLESVVNYMLVYDICCNRELRHPKSVFLHKATVDSKYMFGPIWDFDWCFSFDQFNVIEPQTHLFMNRWNNGAYGGAEFFYALCLNKRFQQRFRERWEEFYSDMYPAWLEYFDEYAARIEASAFQNGQRWTEADDVVNAGTTADFVSNVAAMRRWIVDRIEFINSDPRLGLFQQGDLFGN